jgi:hypothetical protein
MNKQEEEMIRSLPKEWQDEFAEMQAVAAQSQIAMPSVDIFVFAKKNSVEYNRVFRIDGVTFGIRRE